MGPIRNINHSTGDHDAISSPTSIMTTGVPYPQKSRRKRTAYTLPGDHFSSPSDSGYGSGYISTPENPRQTTEAATTISPRKSPKTPTPATRQPTLTKDDRPTADLQISFDGNTSEPDDQFRQSVNDILESSVYHAAARRRASNKPFINKKKSATLPIQSRIRPRPALPASFSSDSRIRTQHPALNKGPPRATSIRQPDRFIPARAEETTESLAEIFRTGRSVHEMTTAEKLLRHDRATEDAFCFRRRVVTPLASDYRSPVHMEILAASSWNRAGRVLGAVDQNTELFGVDRRSVSVGAVWAVGGVAPNGTAIDDGHGHLVTSGTNAPLYRTTFPTDKPKAEEEIEKHGARLATALGIDRTRRVLKVNVPSSLGRHSSNTPLKDRTKWNGTEWVKSGLLPTFNKAREMRSLPTAPFKVLDAPNLRDDFYCSILAYSGVTNTLAVGLGNLLYAWSDTEGVRLLNRGIPRSSRPGECHITSVAFSSEEGGKAILAFARSNCTVGLISMADAADELPGLAASGATSLVPRMKLPQKESPASCLAWKPTTTLRPSRNPFTPGVPVETEELLVGNEQGQIVYYTVEWPEGWEVKRDNWSGCYCILAVIQVHTQQICGLSWSANGEYFASGGNDNLCHIFETSHVLKASKRLGNFTDTDHERDDFRTITKKWVPCGTHVTVSPEISGGFRQTYMPLERGCEKYRWVHGAAVKAIAFCPWQDGLLATGGGSNDKCIHFYHTSSGASLATISVSAQVTSLIWSTSRREIAATFGYAQPEHPIRIAVFSWPDCRQVAAIPWTGEHRALYAIPYPIDPPKEKRRSLASIKNAIETGIRAPPRRFRSHDRRSRRSMEGCIIVASSDKSVKFHEIWPADNRVTPGRVGMLGGSDILESMEGIDRDEEVIR